MNSSMLVEIDPVRQVFGRVHGVPPVGLSQREVILQTIEVIGNPAWVDKNLAKMYLAAVVQFDFVYDHDVAPSVLEAAKEVFGITSNSIDELIAMLDYQ